MSVDFNSMPRDEPGLGESDTPMFAPVPAWERSRKRRSFGGKARVAAPEVAIEPTPVRNAAYVEADDEAFAPTPTYASRTVKRSGGVAPLAIAAGIVAIGGLAAAGWYATQNRDTGMAQLTPGTEVASTPVAQPPELTASAAPTPGEPASAAPAATPATPAKAAVPPARVTTRVAAAAPARTRPAAASRSAEDAGVNTSATLPAAPQPYSGAATAPSAPADIAPAPAAPVNPTPQAVKPAPADATPVTPPAAATPPVTTPPQ